MGFDVNRQDIWLLARVLNQYELQAGDWVRLQEAFSDIEFNGDRAHNAELVLEYVSQHDGLAEVIFKIDPEQVPEGVKTSWRWRSLADAYADRPPRDYVLEGVLPRPGLVVVFGPPASFKTMILQYMAMCVAIGRDYCLESEPGALTSVEGIPCKQGMVLWVDVDNGEDRTARRFKALGTSLGIIDPDSVPLRFVNFPDPPFLANQDDAVQMVVDEANFLEAKLIVFDNLGTISGVSDENSSQMIQVMLGLRKISEQTGAAVVVVHHPNKALEHIRGHTSILAAVDLALQVKRDDGEDALSLRSVKSRDKPVEPLGAEFSFQEDDAGELVAARFYGTGKPDNQKSQQEKAMECILAYINGRMNQSQLIELVQDQAGVGRNSALRALAALERDGDLQVIENGRAKFYFKA